jgi:hypothetical protein
MARQCLQRLVRRVGYGGALNSRSLPIGGHPCVGLGQAAVTATGLTAAQPKHGHSTLPTLASQAESRSVPAEENRVIQGFFQNQS